MKELSRDNLSLIKESDALWKIKQKGYESTMMAIAILALVVATVQTTVTIYGLYLDHFKK